MNDSSIPKEKMNTTVSYIESLSDAELAALTVKLDKKRGKSKEYKNL